jgi:hypothetical protein
MPHMKSAKKSIAHDMRMNAASGVLPSSAFFVAS